LTVARREEVSGIVRDIPASFEADRLKRDLRAVLVEAKFYGVSAAKPVKEIVKAAIFLNDNDDVLNLSAGGGAVDSLKRCLLRLLIREW
jgi:hypothetical protein